jgi:hypothetical protein
MLNSIKITFEDYFLPINMPSKYRNYYDAADGKINLRKIIFKTLWKKFKINNDNYKYYVNSYRLIDLDRDTMTNKVFNRLGPFLINENFLDIDYVIDNPCSGEYKEIKTSENTKVKTFYDLNSRKFETSSYDFIFDEFLERNVDNSYYAKFHSLRQGRYNLAQVLIFIPEKYNMFNF